MYIHTTNENEAIKDIAKAYGVSCESIINNNELVDVMPTVGEEILILTPTRTYTVRYGDTLERLAIRFGMRRADITALNPWIETDGLTVGSEIALKYDERKYGMAVANGYFYSDCNIMQLRRVLPFLSYVTIAAAVCNNGNITPIMNDSEILKMLQNTNKIPLIRIYDKSERCEHLCGKQREQYINSLIDYARKKNYKGIVLNVLSRFEREFMEFIVELKGKMIGCDLILFTESDENTDMSLAEYSDGTILEYSKLAQNAPPSFSNGERKVFGNFACESESAKTFIGLPCFAKSHNHFTTVIDAIKEARRKKCKICRNEETLLCSFEEEHDKKCTFASLKNIKATLELLSEFGFMGISFDIMKTPQSYIMMYNAMFKTVGYTFENSKGGCARDA